MISVLNKVLGINVQNKLLCMWSGTNRCHILTASLGPGKANGGKWIGRGTERVFGLAVTLSRKTWAKH